jgi:methionine-rich copper-binding protein CopC
MKKAILFACSFVATSMIIAACGELTGPKSPETPINVTATLTSPTTAVINWAPSPQSDGVISYNILRNGTKIGEATGTTYTDNSLAEKTTYKYTVSANCTSGVLSDPSAESPAATVTTADLTGPRIVAISPTQGQTNVSTAATVTATFNEAIDPNTINTTTFSLKITGGANIPGTVTYNATTFVAEFKPTSALPSGANITATVTAGVKDIAGNALQLTVGSPGIWSFTTRDDQPPTVTAVSPPNGAVVVAANTAVNITFSEPMDQATITGANITLRVTGGAAVAGVVTYNGTTRVATFTPSAALSVPVNYTVTVSTGVKDVAGNPLAATFTSTFTTADLTPPTLTSFTPANAATNIPVNTTVTATFSKAMDVNTINTGTFQLKTTVGGTPVAGVVTYNSGTNTATFTPSAPLNSQTAYTATITTGAKDTFGNALAAAVPWTFSTADVSAPTVTAVSPTAGQANVSTGTAVTITFSEPMDPLTINTSTITLKTTATSVSVNGTVAYNNGTNTATFTPSGALANGTGYTVTVTTGAKDASGNPLANQFVSTFTTASVPSVVSTNPVDGETNASVATTVTATFSESMDPNTILNPSTFTVKTTGGAAVAGTVTYDQATKTATFTPTSALSNNTNYTATITTGAKNLGGVGIAANKVWAFTTNSPTVTATSPTNGATGIATNTVVTVTFSENMDASTIISPATTFNLKVTSSSAAVGGTVTYNAGTRVATFTPTSALIANTNYTATVTTAAKDAGGNPLASQVTIVFTTAP